MPPRKIALAVVSLFVTLGAVALVRPPQASHFIITTPARAAAHSANTGYEIFLSIPERAEDRGEGIALLERADRLQEQGSYAAAIKAYDRAAARLPQLADWITVFAANSAACLGDTVEVARRLGSVDEDLATNWGWRIRSRGFEKAGARQRALGVAVAAAASGPASKRSAAWLRVATLQRELGMASERSAFINAIKTAPESESAGDAAFALASETDLSAEAHLLVGRALARNGYVAKSVQQLKAALASGHFNADESSDLRYELGRTLFATGKYEAAVTVLSDVAESAERAADARFLLGRAQYRLDRGPAGRATFNDLIETYPASRAATRALFYLADAAQDDGDLDDALTLFQRAAAAPGQADESAQALMRVGDIALINKQYDKAASAFQQLRERYPDGEYHDQATYWAAVSQLRNGNHSTADELLRELRRTVPVSYYGIRAAELLDESPFDNLAAGPHVNEALAKLVSSGMDRWALLHDVGWNEAASFELSRLKRHFEDEPTALYAIGEQFLKRGEPQQAIATGRELVANGASWNRRLLKILYPMPYQSLIEREARAHRLDPYFVAALIRQESRFNAKAVSGVGAIGLMQVMPATGKQLRKKTRVGRITAAKLVQPEPNIKLGTKFLSDLMGMYDGRVDAVLVAYNAGPSRADRWRNFPEFRSEDLFVERIPFDETREYVKVVKLNAAIYRALYARQESAD